MPSPSGFSYDQRPDGTVVVWHHGKVAAKLRGPRAAEFVDEAESGDAQLVMARWTGHYKHGNERTARQHPRNRR
ncbi:hypothetical protein OG871_33415 [Kitasatospora sp. NBC_00374]|uniref:hypothetical protein n=1 Tax=Kitasatospora sp. NBC_00374 TaxID=2975964 RepID=UPI00324FC636